MLFLNIGLLFGILAVAVPVLIHLINRMSAKFYDWGAMQFLFDSMVSRKRRILLEEILLLATRCLLIALVALAMARPFVPESSQIPWIIVLPMILLAITAFGISFALWRYPMWRKYTILGAAGLILLACLSIAAERWLDIRRFGGRGRRDVALIIDGSTSMTMTINGKTNFKRALEEAEKNIKSASRGTAFSIIIGGPVPIVKMPAPITDRRELMAILDEINPSYGSMQALDALSAAAVSLAQGYNPAKQIIMITDGQSIGWETDSPSHWQFLTDTFKNLPTMPQIIYRKLDLPQEFRNAALADITFSRAVIGTDREVAINIRVENTGTEAITPAEIKLKVDDNEMTDNTIGQLMPGSSETFSFPHRFKKIGSHILTAQVIVDDELSADNTRSIAVNVIGKLHVLIVDGNPAGCFMKRAAAFTALALKPDEAITEDKTKQPGKDMNFLVEPELIDAPDIAEYENFDKYSVVILTDVPRLPSDIAKKIAQYVTAGGGLLIAPGNRALAEFYNMWMAKAQSFTPARMKKYIVIADKDDEVHPSISTFTHRALRLISNVSQSDIGSVNFEAYWKLNEQELDENVSVGGRMNNGDPLLIERKVGKGFVLMTACSLDNSGSNLASRHSFLPLIHEMVYYLANATGVKLNIKPGHESTLQLASNTPGSSQIGAGGLKGDYYNAKKKKIVLTRLDPTINFNWMTNSPANGVHADNFEVHWTGSIMPRYSENYTFDVKANDLINVWIDRKRIVKNNKQGTIDLNAGHWYDVRVEFMKKKENAAAHLYWSSKSQPREIIPACRLSIIHSASSFRTVPMNIDVIGPNNEKHNAKIVSIGENIIARIDENINPGLYRIHIPDLVKKPFRALLDKDDTIPFTVISNVGESRVAVLDAADNEFIKKFVDFVEAKSVKDVQKALAGKVFGEELWKYLAWAALFFVICEIFLTRWIASQRKTGKEKIVNMEEQTKPSASFREQLSKLQTTTR